MKQEYAKVEGKEHLIKTPHGAVINTDVSALQKAKQLKQQKLQEIERINKLEEKVDKLTELMYKLLEDKE